MERTESKTITIGGHGGGQEEIDFHKKFHWSLLDRQDVNASGQPYYHIKNKYLKFFFESEDNINEYTKLSFTRDLDMPNIDEIKKLEEAYYGLKDPSYRHHPDLFPFPFCFFGVVDEIIPLSKIVFWGILTLFFGFGIVIWLAYFFMYYRQKNAEVQRENVEVQRARQANMQERQRILSEVEKFN